MNAANIDRNRVLRALADALAEELGDAPDSAGGGVRVVKTPRPARPGEPHGDEDFVTLAWLASKLELKTARAARDWCKRHSVPYRRDGKVNRVRWRDARAAIESLPIYQDEDSREKIVERAAMKPTGYRRK